MLTVLANLRCAISLHLENHRFLVLMIEALLFDDFTSDQNPKVPAL